MNAEHLSYRQGASLILDDVSVQIPNGIITTIIGPNGAGKSSLLHCLTGAIQPNTGCVQLNNKDITSYSLPALAKKRAVLSQSNKIDFPFTVLEIASMGFQVHEAMDENLKAEIVQQVLETVDAWHLRNRLFPTLSGGEQQRVHFARVWIQIWQKQNTFLFLDEPTSALDLKHQHHLFQLLRQLATKYQVGLCVVLHDLNLVSRYADRVILLNQGKLIVSDTTEKVLTDHYIESVFEVPVRFAISG